MYIIVAILAFGILIADHELGHFIAAKLCGVRVNEFAIGMGPAIFKKQKGETLYALRLLPIGGYCAMEGEDEETGDPRAFTSQPKWKRFIILVAGAFNNFMLGLLILIIIFSGAKSFATNRVAGLADGFKYAEGGLEVGDEVYSIDGHRIYYTQDFSTYMSRAEGSVDMVVIRNGERVELDNYGLKPEYYDDVYRYGVNFSSIEANAWEKLKYSCYSAYNFTRMVWMGLGDLVTGKVGMNEMSGVVGIVSTINEVGEKSATVGIAIENIAYLVAFIAVNLAVMNLLPLPALDGGRILFLAVDGVWGLITGRKIAAKYEGWVHAAGMVALLALMAFVMFNDIMKLIR